MTTNSILCKLFGHLYVETPIVLSLRIMPEGGQWQEIAHSAQTTVCRRCGFLPVMPEIVVGTQDAHVAFTPRYSIEGLGVLLGQDYVKNIEGLVRPSAPDFPTGEVTELGTRAVYDSAK